MEQSTINHQNQATPSVDIEKLLQKTHDNNEIIKRQALEDLNKILPPLAAQRAEELLKDPDYIVRMTAIHILQSQQHCMIHLKKVRPLLNDEHYAPRYAVLEFMHKVAPDEAISHAENMLDDDFMVFSLAITIIAEQNNKKAHQILHNYVKHDDPRIRVHSLDLLVQYGVPGTEPLLKKALSDQDDYVRLRTSTMRVKRKFPELDHSFFSIENNQ